MKKLAKLSNLMGIQHAFPTLFIFKNSSFKFGSAQYFGERGESGGESGKNSVGEATRTQARTLLHVTNPSTTNFDWKKMNK